MTVRAMINLLKDYPEDGRVVVSGHEKGHDDLSPEQISVIPMVPNTGIHEWEGQNRNPGDLRTFPQEAATIIEALALHRASNC